MIIKLLSQLLDVFVKLFISSVKLIRVGQ